MLELMSQEALRVGAERRREVALDTMRASRQSDGLRRAAGVAIVALGERLASAGEARPQLAVVAGTTATATATGDCA